MFELEQKVAETPAQTIPGVLAQVRYLAVAARGEGPDQEAALANVGNALARLVGKEAGLYRITASPTGVFLEPAWAPGQVIRLAEFTDTGAGLDPALRWLAERTK